MGKTLDLSDYPDFLGKPFKIVIGAAAPTSDVVGGIDIARSLFTPSTTQPERNYIREGIAILDTDINENIASKNLIVVGSPDKNIIAAKLLKSERLMTKREMENLGFKKSHGMIKLFTTSEGYVHILVSGYEAPEVLGACSILANYSDYQIKGTELDVLVADINVIELLKKEIQVPLDVHKIVTDKMFRVINELKISHKNRLYNACMALSGCLIEITIKTYLRSIFSIETTKEHMAKLKERGLNPQGIFIDKMTSEELIRILSKIETVDKFLLKELRLIRDLRNHFIHEPSFDFEGIKSKFKESKVNLSMDIDWLNDEEKMNYWSRWCAQTAIDFTIKYCSKQNSGH